MPFALPIRHNVTFVERWGDSTLVQIRYNGRGAFKAEDCKPLLTEEQWAAFRLTEYAFELEVEGRAVFDNARGLLVSNERRIRFQTEGRDVSIPRGEWVVGDRVVTNDEDAWRVVLLESGRL